MMPCKLCGLHDANGNIRKGLKQVGKTKLRDVTTKNRFGEFIHPNAGGERIYKCQDCGARFRMTYNAVDKTSRDEPVLTLIEGGSDE